MLLSLLCFAARPQGKILPPLKDSLYVYLASVDGGTGAMETASNVLKHWHGWGATTLATPSQIDGYLKSLRGQKPPQGPRRCGGRSSSKRHVSAIPAMAALLGNRNLRRQLTGLIGKHEVTVDAAPVKYTAAEMVEQVVAKEEEMAARQEEHKVKETDSSTTIRKQGKQISKLKKLTTVKGVSKAVCKEQKAKYSDMLKVLKTEHKEQLSAAKTEHKEKLADTKEDYKQQLSDYVEATNAKLAEIRETAAEEAEQQLGDKLKRTQDLKTEAHAEKRAWKERAENAEHLAALRLAEMKELQCKNASILEELEDSRLELEKGEEGGERQQQLEAWARQQAMPRWEAYRAAKGRGGNSFDTNYRVTIYAAIANQVPLSAIGPTIVDVVKRTAPWLNPKAPSPRMLSDARFEVRLPLLLLPCACVCLRVPACACVCLRVPAVASPSLLARMPHPSALLAAWSRLTRGSA